MRDKTPIHWHFGGYDRDRMTDMSEVAAACSTTMARAIPALDLLYAAISQSRRCECIGLKPDSNQTSIEYGPKFGMPVIGGIYPLTNGHSTNSSEPRISRRREFSTYSGDSCTGEK